MVRQLGRHAVVVQRLEDHPNLPEVLGVLAQLAHIRDEDLPLLAPGWANSPSPSPRPATARSRPDSPLVVEVLSAFDAVSALFADDLAGAAVRHRRRGRDDAGAQDGPGRDRRRRTPGRC